MLECLKEKGKIVTVYGGCTEGFDIDDSVLMDFIEYIAEYSEIFEMDDWVEALYQILCWQFQSMHEGVITYYENFYGESDYPVLVKTAKFLKENGYLDIYEPYYRGICEQYGYPESMQIITEEIDIDMWINWHEKEVWDFCVDILEKHKEEWFRKIQNKYKTDEK